MTQTMPVDAAFITDWNERPRRERLLLRRLARMGRPGDSPEAAALIVQYARFQRSRIWARLFWAWFVPGLVLALGVATQVHPAMIGVVLALAAQAVFTRRNLRRAEQVNAAVLSES